MTRSPRLLLPKGMCPPLRVYCVCEALNGWGLNSWRVDQVDSGRFFPCLPHSKERVLSFRCFASEPARIWTSPALYRSPCPTADRPSGQPQREFPCGGSTAKPRRSGGSTRTGDQLQGGVSTWGDESCGPGRRDGDGAGRVPLVWKTQQETSSYKSYI